VRESSTNKANIRSTEAIIYNNRLINTTNHVTQTYNYDDVSTVA